MRLFRQIIPLLFTIALGAAASAASPLPSVQVTAPPARTVAPGDYVTLVFHLVSTEDQDVDVSASSPPGWTVLRQPGTIHVLAQVPVPIAITVKVPVSASPDSLAEVRLSVSRGQASTSDAVELRPRRTTGVSIVAPDTGSMDTRTIDYSVRNDGNVDEKVAITVKFGDSVVASESHLISPGTRIHLSFAVVAPGTYVIDVASATGAKAVKSIRIRGFGVPKPPSLQLHGFATGSVDSGSHWRGVAHLTGPLSDFAVLAASVDAADPTSSYLELQASGHDPVWSVEFGALGDSPNGIPIESVFGTRGTIAAPTVMVSAATGVIGSEPVGRLDGRLRTGNTTISGSTGVVGGRLEGGLGIDTGTSRTTGSAMISSLAGQVDLVTSIAARRPEDDAIWTVRVDGLDIGSSGSSWTVQSDVTRRSERWYGLLVASPSTGRVSQWRLSDSTVVPTPLPGKISLLLDAGTRSGAAKIRYLRNLDDGWGVRADLGAGFDGTDFGPSAGASFTFAPDSTTFAALSADATWFPATGGWAGQVQGSAQEVWGPLGAYVGASWRLDNGNLGVATSIHYSTGTFVIEGSGSGFWRPQSAAGSNWDLGVSLGATLLFDLDVPRVVAEAFGGRRNGVIAGHVGTPDTPLIGVTVEIGPYLLKTDREGNFSATLPPGSYRVSVDTTTIPLRYVLTQPERRTVEVAVRKVTRADFLANETAAMYVHVNPPANRGMGFGTAASVIVMDSRGVQHTSPLSPDGDVVVRGLPDGLATIRLAGLPDTVVASDLPKSVALRAGEVASVSIDLESSLTSAKVFGGNSLRVRSVSVTPSRIAPGAAPVVTVKTSAAADAVNVAVDGQVTALVGEGTEWSGRVPIPPGTDTSAVLKLVVKARKGAASATRDATLVVDPALALGHVTVPEAPSPGGQLVVQMDFDLEPSRVMVSVVGLGETLAERSASGSWIASLHVPSTARPGVYLVKVEFRDAQGRPTELQAKARIGN